MFLALIDWLLMTGLGNKAPKQRKLSSVITAESSEAVMTLQLTSGCDLYVVSTLF
jgi:hypothetical protein